MTNVCRIPLCVPEIGGNEWIYVKECLDTGWVSSAGSYVTTFESRFSEIMGGGHAVAVASGTAALHLALAAAGVQANDEVLVSDLTFIAPANAIRYLGAHPVLVDVDPATGQIDAALVREFLTAGCERTADGLVNRETGRPVRAILPVSTFGHPADLAALEEIAKDAGLPMVSDTTESLGASVGGRPVGMFGDIACFSFNGNKLITTGGGGMIFTRNKGLADRTRHLSTQAKKDTVEFVHDEVGFNYRLTNVAAAIGCAQLERLDEFVTRKHEIARSYRQHLSDLPGLRFLEPADGTESAHWLTVLLVDGGSRPLYKFLASAGVETRPPWTPVHGNPPFAHCQTIGGSVAERLHEDGLCLPSSTSLGIADQEAVIGAIKHFFHQSGIADHP